MAGGEIASGLLRIGRGDGIDLAVGEVGGGGGAEACVGDFVLSAKLVVTEAEALDEGVVGIVGCGVAEAAVGVELDLVGVVGGDAVDFVAAVGVGGIEHMARGGGFALSGMAMGSVHAF